MAETLIIAGLNNLTGNSYYDEISNLPTSVQNFSNKQIYTFNSSIYAENLGSACSNGNFKDLENFIRSFLLDQPNNQKITEKFIEANNKDEIVLLEGKNYVPSIIGNLSMYGKYNNFKIVEEILEHAFNSEDYKIIKNNTENKEVDFILFRNNEEICVDQFNKYSIIVLLSIQITPLNLRHFETNNLNLVNEDMVKIQKKDKRENFGNHEHWNVETVAVFLNNKILNSEYLEPQDKTLVAQLQVRKLCKESYNHITGRYNRQPYNLAGFFYNDNVGMILNPDYPFKLDIGCPDCYIKATNECPKDMPNNLILNIIGMKGYAVTTADIATEKVAVGKIIQTPLDTSLLGEYLLTNIPLRSTKEIDSQAPIDQIYNFFQQKIKILDDFYKRHSKHEKTNIVFWESPAKYIPNEEFSNTLKIVHLKFRDNSDQETNTEEIYNTNNQLPTVTVDHITGNLQDIELLEKYQRNKLEENFAIEEIYINHAQLEFDKALILPINSLGGQLVCSTDWHDKIYNTKYTGETRISNIMPGPIAIIIRKKQLKGKTFITYCTLPLTPSICTGSKSKIYNNGLTVAENPILLDDKNKKILNAFKKDEIATQFSSTQVYKQENNIPASVFLKTTTTEKLNYLRKDKKLVSNCSKSNIDNYGAIEIRGTHPPRPTAFNIKYEDKIVKIPLNVTNSQKPENYDKLSIEKLCDGHLSYRPSYNTTQNIIYHVKQNTNNKNLKRKPCKVKQITDIHQIIESLPLQFTKKIKKTSDETTKFTHTRKHGTLLNIPKVPHTEVEHNHVVTDKSHRMNNLLVVENEKACNEQKTSQNIKSSCFTHNIKIEEIIKNFCGMNDTKKMADFITKTGSLQRTRLSHNIQPVGIPISKLGVPSKMDETYKIIGHDIIEQPVIGGLQSFLTVFPINEKTKNTKVRKNNNKTNKLPILQKIKKSITRTFDIQDAYDKATETNYPLQNTKHGHFILQICMGLRKITRLLLTKEQAYRAFVNEVENISTIDYNVLIDKIINQWQYVLQNNINTTNAYNNATEAIEFINCGLPGYLRSILIQPEICVEEICIFLMMLCFIYSMTETTAKLTKLKQSTPKMSPEAKESRMTNQYLKIGLLQSKNMLAFVLSLGNKVIYVREVLCDILQLYDQIPEHHKKNIYELLQSTLLKTIIQPDITAKKIIPEKKKLRLSKQNNPIIKNKEQLAIDEYTMFLGSKTRISDIVKYMNKTPKHTINNVRKILVDLILHCDALIQKPASSLILNNTLDKIN